MGVEEYLAQFPEGSPDHALLRQRAEKLRSVLVRRVKGPGGRLFEDTVFVEKAGLTYTVRLAL